MGRSKAQDQLMEEICEMYPSAYVTDEVYIKDLIEERGYTTDEIARELGNKPHKMYVDIVMRDSDRTVAFEYHGQQHYKTIGNMTKTTADVLMNQQLDQEKSWILSRIGIPLVAVPYDMYVDESVIEHMIDEATDKMLSELLTMPECPECGRRFPQSQMKTGVCRSCRDKLRDRTAEPDRSSSNGLNTEEDENGNTSRNSYKGKGAKKTMSAAARRSAERRKRREERTARKEESWTMYVNDDNTDSGDYDQNRDIQEEIVAIPEFSDNAANSDTKRNAVSSSSAGKKKMSFADFLASGNSDDAENGAEDDDNKYYSDSMSDHSSYGEYDEVDADPYDELGEPSDDNDDEWTRRRDEYEKRRKAEAKRRRQEAYRAWKESPEYEARKAQEKERRKEDARKAKAARAKVKLDKRINRGRNSTKN